MCGDVNRYFIELLPSDGSAVPRYLETEKRRAQAARFLETVSEWLETHDLASKVVRLAVTALGQVQITCEPDVINQIRNDEDLNIGTIRQSSVTAGTMLAENPVRWNEAY